MVKWLASVSGLSAVAVVTLPVWLFAQTPLLACEYTTMRDAAFDAKRDFHRLRVIGHADDPRAQHLFKRLGVWIEKHDSLNLDVRFLDVEDETLDWWGEYGIPSPPADLPVTALFGRRTFDRKSWFMEHWTPAPTDDELQALVNSPARRAIREAVGERLAVLLYVPSADEDRHASEVEKIVKYWDATADEWFGLELVRVDRRDEAESLLAGFAQLKSDGADWLGIVFGKGKLMAPPLEGDQITLANVNELLARITAECTCLQNPTSLGVDLLMSWTPEDQKRYRPHKQAPELDEGQVEAEVLAVAAESEPISTLTRSAVVTLVGLAVFVGVAALGLVIRKNGARHG